ncbi:MAG: fucose-binding protein [Beijerinckiaceae bacterium]|nr:fucose-binding protein [Beijerinckiaceae bacterium]MCZ8300069.1 fucose-binding protein [Beijerinckiaceae bacterium]
MLKGMDPRLPPDLLFLLARMGHGDDLAIVDANHPAEAVAASTVTGELVRLPGLTADSVLEAVLTLFPLDDFTEDPVRFMQVVGKPDERPEAVQAMERVARRAGYVGAFHTLERFAFYAAARSSFAVVQCGEQRLYGNVLIRMGALAPD